MKDVSIIIVNYKTPGLVADCLASLFRQPMTIAIQVIVVDNDSGDNSESVICQQFPAVKWIQMGYNAGFARANNQGIRQSDARAVLLLNSDTLVEGNAVEKSYHDMIRLGYAACGVQLLNVDRTPQISGNYFFKGGLNVLLPLPCLGRFYKWLGDTMKMKKPNVAEATDVVDVDWINGAYLMVTRSACQAAGLLDEDFFLYAEEVEWCSRLRKQGKLCIFGQYHVVHLQGQTANQTFKSAGKGYYNVYDRKGLQIMVSNFLRIRKHLGTGWLMVNLLHYILEVPLFAASRFLVNVFTLQHPFRHFGLVGGYSGNVWRLVGFMPRMISGKPYFYKVL